MNDLLARAIAAHGGLERWNTFTEVTATVVAGGGLLPTRRRAYVRGPGLKPIRDLLLISLDLSNLRLTTW